MIQDDPLGIKKQLNDPLGLRKAISKPEPTPELTMADLQARFESTIGTPPSEERNAVLADLLKQGKQLKDIEKRNQLVEIYGEEGYSELKSMSNWENTKRGLSNMWKGITAIPQDVASGTFGALSYVQKGAGAIKDKALDQLPEDSTARLVGDKVTDAFNTGWIFMSTALPQLIATGEFSSDLQEATGRSAAIAESKKEGMEMTKPFTMAAQEGVGGVASAAVNGTLGYIPSLIVGASTRGMGFVQYFAGSQVNEAAAIRSEATGKEIEQLFAEEDADIAVPLFLGGVAGILEAAGFKLIKNFFTKPSKEVIGKVAELFANTGVQGVVNWLESGLYKYNEVYTTTRDHQTAAEESAGYLFSQQGLDAGLEAAAGTLLMGGVGKAGQKGWQRLRNKEIDNTINEVASVNEVVDSTIDADVNKHINEVKETVDSDTMQVEDTLDANDKRVVTIAQEADESVAVDNSPDGNFVNVGMKVGQTDQNLTAEQIKEALPKDVKVFNEGIVEGTEPTLSLELSRPLNSEEMSAFLAATQQMAIPQVTDKKGTIHGSKEWGKFDSKFFVLPDGKKLSDVRKPAKTELQKQIDKDTGVTREKSPVKKDEYALLKDRIRNFARGWREGRTDVRKQRKQIGDDIRKDVRENKLTLSPQQSSKVIGLINQINDKNTDKKIGEIDDYLRSIERGRANKAAEGMAKEIVKNLNPKTHQYQGESKRAKTKITADAKQKLMDVAKEFIPQIPVMLRNENHAGIQSLNDLVNAIVESGKADQKAVTELRNNIRKANTDRMTKQLGEKFDKIVPVSSKQDAIKQVKAGNRVMIGDVLLKRSDLKDMKNMSESLFTDASAVAIPSANQITERLPILQRLKSMVYQKTDLVTMLNAFATDKESKAFIEETIIKPYTRANNLTLNDKVAFGDAVKSLKDKVFGKGKSKKLLTAKTDLELKDLNGKDLVAGKLTNDEAVYVYNILKQPDLIDKAINAKFNSEQLVQIVEYVNANPKLKQYADEVVGLYKENLSKVNDALERNGYDTIVPGEYGPIKQALMELAGQSGQDKISELQKEIKAAKKDLLDAENVEKAQKEIEAKEKKLEKLTEQVGIADAKAAIFGAIYGDLTKMPDQVPYTPARVDALKGQEFDISQMFSSRDGAVSIMADNVIERIKGGELRIMPNEQMMFHYMENMLNMVNKLDLYRNMFSMFKQGGANMKLIQERYGRQFAQNFTKVLQDAVVGKNTNQIQGFETIMNEINSANATVMFLNLRSAILQATSAPNFLEQATKDGVLGETAAGMFNFNKENVKDIQELMDSGWFRSRIDQTHAQEFVDLRTAKDPSTYRKALNALLRTGYKPSQLMDTYVGVLSIGAPYYSALKNKLYKQYSKDMSSAEAMDKAKAEALDKFSFHADETQQTRNPMFMSVEQKNPVSRLFLGFSSVNLLYTRKMIRAAQDYKNGRMSMKAAAGTILYYGGLQQVIFLTLQQGLAYVLGQMAFGNDDRETEELAKSKALTVANQTFNAALRGLGIYGVMIGTTKDFIYDATKKYEANERKKSAGDRTIEYMGNLSPSIGIKAKRAQDFYKNMARDAGGEIKDPIRGTAAGAEFLTNIPVSQVYRYMDMVEDMNNEYLDSFNKFLRVLNFVDYDTMQKARKKQESGTGGSQDMEIPDFQMEEFQVPDFQQQNP